jgi:DNA-binding NarL/FixJ family response regulator
MNERIRLLIVEDETIVVEAIRALLEMEQAIEVIGEAANGKEAIWKANSLKPDVILLDLRLPDRAGSTLIGELMQQNPSAHILVLTAYANDSDVVAAFKAGAVGYVLKSQAVSELVQAIKSAHQGRSVLHPRIAHIMLRELNHPVETPVIDRRLSEAELRVLVFVAQGLANKDIAIRLGVSCTTVRAHISRILTKLRLDNRTQVALYALRQGLSSVKVALRS